MWCNEAEKKSVEAVKNLLTDIELLYRQQGEAFLKNFNGRLNGKLSF